MFIYIFLLWLIKLTHSEVVIHNSGVGYIDTDDMAMIFFITLENSCKNDLEIFVNMTRCCEMLAPDEEECQTMYLIGGFMGTLKPKEIKNVTLIYPNLYLINREGSCTVEVSYQSPHKKAEVNKDIFFQTHKIAEDGVLEEISSCTSVDSDPLDDCKPIDCLVRYSGERNYYDTKLGRCECVPICVSDMEKCIPDVAYIQECNKCRDLRNVVTKTDLSMIETNRGHIQPNACFRDIWCHNGEMDNVTENCECHTDWITSMSGDEIYEPRLARYHMCNIETNDWNTINKNKIRTTALLIGIFAVTIVSKVLILMCLLNWCYTFIKAPQDQKICDRREHPDDDAYIICENTKSFGHPCYCTVGTAYSDSQSEEEEEEEEQPLEPPKGEPPEPYENIETVPQTDKALIPGSKRGSVVEVNYLTNISQKSIFKNPSAPSIRSAPPSANVRFSVQSEGKVVSKQSDTTTAVSFETDTESGTGTSSSEDESDYEIEFSEEESEKQCKSDCSKRRDYELEEELTSK